MHIIFIVNIFLLVKLAITVLISHWHLPEHQVRHVAFSSLFTPLSPAVVSCAFRRYKPTVIWQMGMLSARFCGGRRTRD